MLGTFASWYFASGRAFNAETMSAVANRSFLFTLVAHTCLLLALATFGALSVAGELDRKTVGFLLVTRLGSAEIVLGKLAGCLAGFASSLAAGLPVMILLNVVAGVHPTLIHRPAFC